MATYLVTGGTGFLGRRVVRGLLDRDRDAVIHMLVPDTPDGLATEIASDRVVPLIGDPCAAGLGLREDPPRPDHIVHLATACDATADEETAYAADVTATRSVIALAAESGAMLHHLSSIAVAGDHRGAFFEDDFDLGQNLATPFQRTKFAAEKLVRETPGLRWRIYRPSIVAGDSRTGEMDPAAGPHRLFPAVTRLAGLPVPLPNPGVTNIVPADYVAAAMARLITRRGSDRRTFHLVAPDPQPIADVWAALARAAGAPSGPGALPGGRTALRALARVPGAASVRDILVRQLGIPAEAARNLSFEAEFVADSTRARLRGLRVPPFESYAGKLWEYWRTHLDPDRARRAADGDPLHDRTVLITGASSGIGLATAHAVARRGATVLMVARDPDELEAAAAGVRAGGGAAQAYPCDITDEKAVELLVKQALADHGRVDYAVNNAARSVHRSVFDSADRMYEFEQTMAVNYFGAVRLVLALLPAMRERRFGHIVNISSIAVQAKVPHLAAYVASKAALDAFGEIAAAENADAGITVTTVRMPLVRTPAIAATAPYGSIPAYTHDRAAALVVRALTERPARIDTPLGTIAQVLDAVAPAVGKSVLRQGLRLLDTVAAADPPEPADRPGPLPTLAPMLRPLTSLPGPAARLAGRIPGLRR